MSNVVHWVLELDVKDGKLDDFKALMEEMVAATNANEPGTTHYEWYLSEDGSTCHLYERYADSDAVMTHLGTFGEKFAKRFLDCVAPSRMTVYGDASEQVRKALAGLGAFHMGQIGGFAR